jgi:hypothetical protein
VQVYAKKSQKVLLKKVSLEKLDVADEEVKGADTIYYVPMTGRSIEKLGKIRLIKLQTRAS